jgi:hypothetical protein
MVYERLRIKPSPFMVIVSPPATDTMDGASSNGRTAVPEPPFVETPDWHPSVGFAWHSTLDPSAGSNHDNCIPIPEVLFCLTNINVSLTFSWLPWKWTK